MMKSMRKRKSRTFLTVLALVSVGAASLARGQTSVPVPARWKDSFDAFSAADERHAPAAGGVVFVGSSSIRLWDNLEEDFQALPVVVKRGFGGSRLSDCSDHVARLVLPYKPKLVIVYAGDNDLAEGATPEEVLASFKRFVEGVHTALPATRIAYLSIKPSPLRAPLMAQARAANQLIRDYAVGVPALDYIDIYSKMLDAAGQPRAELFGPDRLHLSRAGYALWRQEIAAHLGPLAQTPRVTAQPASLEVRLVAPADAPPGAR